MPTLRVLAGGEWHVVEATPGASLREMLDLTPWRVRTGCRGNGSCGLCRVQVLSEPPIPETDADRLLLSRQQLAGGVRLACQIYPSADLDVRVVNPAPPSNWSSPGYRRAAAAPVGAPRPNLPEVAHPCGLAVDLGTTNIALAIHDLESGACLSIGQGANPQAIHGADVMTRLCAAAESAAVASELQRLAADAVGDGILVCCGRDGINPRRIVAVRVVGNAAMLTLMAGGDPQWLLAPVNWTGGRQSIPQPPEIWRGKWFIHGAAEISFVEPLGGFVGSDCLAGLVAIRVREGAAPALFVDFGTNTEIALWDGHRLLVTAGAGGPAFETGLGGIALPAEPGAIHHVGIDGDGLRCSVLPDGPPRGLCGSGLVDLLAVLLGNGVVDERGRFVDGKPFEFSVEGVTFRLEKTDIDVLQRAKAALVAGIGVLCEEAGITAADLRRVAVAGRFGRYLSPVSASAIGLLPPVPAAVVEIDGDAALAGCADILLSVDAGAEADRLRDLARVVNLGHHPSFERHFLAGLYLKPQAGG